MEPRAGGPRGCAGRWHEGALRCGGVAAWHANTGRSRFLRRSDPLPCPSTKTEPETEVPGQERERGNSRESAAVPLVPGRDSAQSPPGNVPAAAESTRGAGVVPACCCSPQPSSCSPRSPQLPGGSKAQPHAEPLLRAKVSPAARPALALPFPSVRSPPLGAEEPAAAFGGAGWSPPCQTPSISQGLLQAKIKA